MNYSCNFNVHVRLMTKCHDVLFFRQLMPGGFVAVGVAVIAVLFVGYFGQRHLPPPKPSFIGLDLGTTFSCVGAYHPVSGNVTIFLTDQVRRPIVATCLDIRKICYRILNVFLILHLRKQQLVHRLNKLFEFAAMKVHQNACLIKLSFY